MIKFLIKFFDFSKNPIPEKPVKFRLNRSGGFFNPVIQYKYGGRWRDVYEWREDSCEYYLVYGPKAKDLFDYIENYDKLKNYLLKQEKRCKKSQDYVYKILE